MKLQLHTISRDKKSYNATAIYDDGKTTVISGSKIKMDRSELFKPASIIMTLLEDKSIVADDGTLQKDVEFDSLSSAATFVTGSVANGNRVWKTADG